MTRLLPKLHHDRFVPRTVEQVRGKTQLSVCMWFRQRVAYLREVAQQRVPPLRLMVAWALSLSLSLSDGPKCYAGIQLVNQSENSTNSLPRFLRGFCSLAGKSRVNRSPVPLYASIIFIHCADVHSGKGKNLQYFIKLFHANMLRFVSIIIPLSSWYSVASGLNETGNLSATCQIIFFISLLRESSVAALQHGEN